MTSIDWSARAKGADLRIRNFIDGQYRESYSADGETIRKHAARDGSLLYTFNAGCAEDVNQAVASAKAAYEDGRWRHLPIWKRKNILHKLADLVGEHKEELALYESLDVGKPITKALQGDIGSAQFSFRDSGINAERILSPSGVDGSTFGYHLRKPIGVVGAIVGWNFPLSLAAGKVGPALAMGNSIVVKPSEFSSLSAGRLAALAIEAGIPPGVFNVVHGAGHTVGSALAHHPDVNLVTFTGSSETGKRIMVAAGQSNMKRMMLECGGKSPYMVFEDCPSDLDAIAADVVGKAFPNQGALCVAGSRVLIHDSLKDKLLPKILALTANITPQDPLDPDSSFGAMINEAHMNKVLAYIDSGEKEGATLLCGGQRVHLDVGDSIGKDTAESGGYYIAPTIFDKVNPQQKIAQEEIFGPVLCVLTFKDEAEAIALANNTCYGLAAYAATENLGRAHRLVQQLDAGLVIIKGSNETLGCSVPLGMEGHKQSGFGMEGGQDWLLSYSVTTTADLLI